MSEEEKVAEEGMEANHAGAETVQPDPTLNPNAVDLTPSKDGGILKEIIKEGSGDEQPFSGAKVFVHYVGKLTDDTIFDSSRDRGEQFNFILGKGNVIKGWDVGVASMKKGEVCRLTCRSEYAYGENGSPPKIPANATLIFEVELFDWEGEDLSEDKDGSLLRCQLEEGSGFQTPNEGSSCEIHYRGKHAGEVFVDKDITFDLGEGVDAGVVEGVEQALKKFKKGEKSRLDIKSKYAYGAEGHTEYGIPPNADLQFEVTLKTFEKAKESWEMDEKEKLEQAEIAKGKGTHLFKTGKYNGAVTKYTRVVDLIEREENLEGEDKEKKLTLMLAARLNMAMCYLKLDIPYKARLECDKVLELDPKNEKGFFRRGIAKLNEQDYLDAVEDFQQVLAIDPNNKAAKNQITIARQKIKQQKDKDKKTYAGMFQRFAEIDAKKEELSKSEEGDVLSSVGEWSNDMADGILTLEQEAAAFGEKTPEPEYNKSDSGKENEIPDDD